MQNVKKFEFQTECQEISNQSQQFKLARPIIFARRKFFNLFPEASPILNHHLEDELGMNWGWREKKSPKNSKKSKIFPFFPKISIFLKFLGVCDQIRRGAKFQGGHFGEIRFRIGATLPLPAAMFRK